MISKKDRLIMGDIHNHYLIPVVDLESELDGFRNTCEEANEKIHRVILCPSIYDICMDAARCLIAGANEGNILQIMSSALSSEALPVVLGKDDEFFDYIKILYSGIFVIGDMEEHKRHSLENIGEERDFENAMLASMTIAATALHMAVSENKIDANVVKELRATMLTKWVLTNPATDRVLSVVKMKDDEQAVFAILLDVTERVNLGDIDVDTYNGILDIFLSYGHKMAGDDIVDELSKNLSKDALGILDKISKKVGEDNA